MEYFQNALMAKKSRKSIKTKYKKSLRRTRLSVDQVQINLMQRNIAKQGSKDLRSYFQMELDTQESGLEMSETGTEFKCGLISRDMKGIGKTIKRMARELSIMLMGMFTQVNGRMIKLMVGANTHMIMGRHMKGSGKKINRMEKVLKLGLMVQNT